jgi:hypothetical protein
MPVFYSPAYTMSAYEFDTTRKATWVATSLQRWRFASAGYVSGAPSIDRCFCGVKQATRNPRGMNPERPP